MRSPHPHRGTEVCAFLPNLDLCHLVKAKLDRSLAAKDGDENLDLAGLCVNLGHRAVEIGKRSADDLDDLPLGEVGSRLLGTLGTHALGELVELLARQRLGLAFRTDEASDARRVANGDLRARVHVGANQNIPGKDLLLGGDATAAFLELGDLFGGNQDVEDVLLETLRFLEVLDVRLDLVLIPRIGMNYVPFSTHICLCSQRRNPAQRQNDDIVDDGDEHSEENDCADDDKARVDEFGASRPDDALHLGTDRLHVVLEARPGTGLGRLAVCALGRLGLFLLLDSLCGLVFGEEALLLFVCLLRNFLRRKNLLARSRFGLGVLFSFFVFPLGGGIDCWGKGNSLVLRARWAIFFLFF